jgi:hypothetical protein
VMTIGTIGLTWSGPFAIATYAFRTLTSQAQVAGQCAADGGRSCVRSSRGRDRQAVASEHLTPYDGEGLAPMRYLNARGGPRPEVSHRTP